MLKPYINRALKLSLVGMMTYSALVAGIEEDFTKAIAVDSKYQFADKKSKKSIFKEQVHIKQGSLNVYADEVEVDASMGEGNEIFIATGKPATYSQKEAEGTEIKASANKIEYRRQSRTLTLDGNAQLKQNNSSVKGELIIFNMQLEQIMAEGEDQESGRVTTIFQPEAKPQKQDKPKQEKQP